MKVSMSRVSFNCHLYAFLYSIVILYRRDWFLLSVTRRILRFFHKIQLNLKIIEKGIKREKKLE